MDDKTEQLRDIFLDVADDATVTETQEEGRGTLATDEESVDDRLQSIIDRLREKFDVRTGLDNERLCHLVRAFYAGEDDDTIATELGCPVEAVFRARMDLHLVRDEDLPGEELAATIRADEGLAATIRADEAVSPDDIEGAATAALADAVGVEQRTAERALAAMAATDRSRRVSHRFRTAFEEVLTDADISVRFTADTHDDGLEDATEGAEVDVEL